MKAGYDRVSSRRNPAYAPRNAKLSPRLLPGRVVGVIAVKSNNQKPGKMNPLVMYFSVNRYRKDLNRIIEQSNRKVQLPAYEESLFESCFKKWV